MSEGLWSTEGDPEPVAGEVAAPPDVSTPLIAYRAALRLYDRGRLLGITRLLGIAGFAVGAENLAATLADHLASPRAAGAALGNLSRAARAAVNLMALAESPAWPWEGLAHALGCLGEEPTAAIRALVDHGVVAARLEPGVMAYDVERELLSEEPRGVVLHVHPTVLAASRTVLPDGTGLPRAGPVRKERETDGLEPIFRVAVVWQRVADAPLRQTQQGSFYKRDRERLEDDPAVAGPIADALEPLPDMPALWLALARGVGLLENEPGTERITAATPEYWAENAYHFPQMIAARWLGLWTWHEQGGMQQENAEVRLALPFARAPVLLWLATLGPDEWVALDDFAAWLRDRLPGWDRPAFQGPPRLDGVDAPPARGKAVAKGSRAKAKSGVESTPGSAALAAVLLGAAYQLNLVRAAEEVDTGRRVVQLSALGRYLLALGPPPQAKPPFDQFLYVQPNFEIIAYRQGLNPALIGRFSRFATWSQVGAALALTLTPESVYRGLEGGLTSQAMFDLLQSHSPRPLPAGVAEALRTWAGRRERVTYHAAATLLEFATTADLEMALAVWPVSADGPAPLRVSDRLLLVENVRAIPYDRFRTTGSRDYRKPAEACVEVEADGVTLTLDPGRSDLLVDAELGRFTDETPAGTPRPRGHLGTGLAAPPSPRRRFTVSADTLARAAESGMSIASLTAWYLRRTGGEVPPAVRLLLQAGSARLPELTAGRPLVVRTPTAELLDGLVQHPETRDLLGERLGPTAVIVADANLEPFRAALARLKLPIAGVGGSTGS